MSLNIIRNCSHFSSVQTALELDQYNQPKCVVRKTFLEEGVRSLLNESNSLTRYCQALGIDPQQEIIAFAQKPSYAHLILNFHEGELGDYYLSISENKGKLEQVIEYYMKVFFKEKPFMSHGDLSLGNIVFNQGQVSWIIDWENANQSMPPEYDLVYCITENCLFRLLKKKLITPADISIYQTLFKKIADHLGIEANCQHKPAQWCKDMAMHYINKTGVAHQKCPFLAVDQKYVEELDRLIGVQ